MNNSEINIGIDTSKAQLDIGIRPSGEFFSIPNNDLGIREAVKRLKRLKPTRALIEFHRPTRIRCYGRRVSGQAFQHL